MNDSERTETVTDEQWEKAVKDMERAGERAGKAAGSWISDGNTPDAALKEIKRLWDEGDPAAPEPPNPFSGEWAGDPTVEDVVDAETDLDAETCTPEELGDLATHYEDAFRDAWYDEAQRTVNAMIPDDGCDDD